ncbi:MAG: phosphatidate cytidylyltransferase [Pseudoflavonifractor sp.]|nr:phosphatidate cytidylyltransferase [Pseudoflavonifractor sp.]
MIVRAISGAVYVALIVISILLGQWSFTAISVLLAIGGMIEFYSLGNSEGGEQKLTLCADIAGGTLLVLGLSASAMHHGDAVTSPLPAVTFLIPYMIYLLARPVMQLYTKEKSPLANLACSYMGQVYVALPLGLMSYIYAVYGSPHLILALFIMIWANDTGAYLVGRAIGWHRLFERISPKKSWEGFWGGLAFTIGAAMVMKYLFPAFFPALTGLQMAGLAVTVTVFATWGDLVESLIKRTLHVKDSGTIMPGHGGVLDRIDSLLLVTPAALLYLLLV